MQARSRLWRIVGEAEGEGKGKGKGKGRIKRTSFARRFACKIARGWKDRHQFSLIVAPEDSVEMGDLRGFTRELMRQKESDLGTQPSCAVILGLAIRAVSIPASSCVCRRIRSSWLRSSTPRKNRRLHAQTPQ